MDVWQLRENKKKITFPYLIHFNSKQIGKMQMPPPPKKKKSKFTKFAEITGILSNKIDCVHSDKCTWQLFHIFSIFYFYSLALGEFYKII